MIDHLSNTGYLAFVKEPNRGVPLTPTDYIPLYDETMNTSGGLQDQAPIVGINFATYNVLPGQRQHKGDVTILCEPNTIARMIDIMLPRISTTGTGPYVHTFALNPNLRPNSATIDISTGNVVNRYWGVEASKISPNWNANELQAKISLSALGSFQSRSIASVSTNTVVLDTIYDPAPTLGLVAGDLIRFKLAAGTVVDLTVSSITNGTTFVASGTPTGVAAGDSVSLRPATPIYNLLPSFLWAKNYWGIGATAAAAITNASSALQTRVEKGSAWDMSYGFNNDGGEDRSGAFDPAVLIRKLGDCNVNIKKLFDTPDDIIAFNNLTKSAIAVRHASGSTNQYGWLNVFNHVKTDGKIVPDLKAGEVEFSDITFRTMQDSTEGQAYSTVVTNMLATI